MRFRIWNWALAATLVVRLSVAIESGVAGETPARGGDLAAKYLAAVRPILQERCFACHGALKQQGALRLDTTAAAIKGGESGAAVVAGKPGESLLIQRITSKDEANRMPPDGKPLTAEQVAALTAWIEAGAAAPANEKPEAEPQSHWAFQRIVRPSAPGVRNDAWTRNPIDAFISEAHEQHGLAPAEEAAPHWLLRRVSLDLVGLPPSRRELHDFLDDVHSRGVDAAYESAVDRLLASPQYGERWGRHWMDVWRYSDWYGRRLNNDVRNSYAQIWRWRDWIIRSLNEDKGYDRMMLEMLAGDELFPEDDEAVVATGYIVRNWYSLNYHQWMKDLVEHTGKAFLGLRLNCAMCHDHKYDPISQDEYFKFRAFFEPLEMRHDRVPGEPDPGPFQKYIYASSTAPMKSGMVRIFDEKLDAQTLFFTGGDSRNVVKDRVLTAGVPAILGGRPLDVKPVPLPATAWYPGLKPFVQREELAKADEAVRAATASLDAARLAASGVIAQATPAEMEVAAAKRKQTIAEADLAAATAQRESIAARIAADKVRFLGVTGDAAALSKSASLAERTATVKLSEHEVALAEAAHAAAVETAKGNVEDANVKKAVEKLAAAQKAVETARLNLAKESDQYSPIGPVYPQSSTGRRTQLALWMADCSNPLTARVAVNHIWMRHFGKPLVESVVDFGRSGKESTHPALLDWLASELMQGAANIFSADANPSPPAPPGGIFEPGNAWRMKRMHRLIVTSTTYRMASTPGADAPRSADGRTADAIDPTNKFYWRFEPRRLEAEAVRDSLLAVTGALDLRMGGQEIDAALAESMPRRSLYFHIHAEDGGLPQFLTLFDGADPTECYRRSENVMPQQALAMTNSTMTLEWGRVLARETWDEVLRSAEAGAPAMTIDESWTAALFEQILTRLPTEAERSACAAFLAKQRALLASADARVAAPPADLALRAREGLVRVLLNHTEFVTAP